MSANRKAGRQIAAAIMYMVCLFGYTCFAQEKAAINAEDISGADEGGIQRIIVTLDTDVISPGEQAHAQVKAYPGGGESVGVTWSSSAPGVAQVDQRGVITAKVGGSVPDHGMDVDIWAQANDGSLAMNCATVRVMPSVRNLSMPQGKMQMNAGENSVAGIVVGIEPATLVGMVQVEWHSSDPSVAKVEGSGDGEVAMIYAHAPGETLITAHAMDGSGTKASMMLIVE